jgi:hypothetical protein
MLGRLSLCLGAGGVLSCAACLPDDAAAPVVLAASLHDAQIAMVDTDDAGTTTASLYPQVVDVIERRCSWERCHAGPLIGAGLSFAPGGDHRAALVGVRACEYDLMARVTPGDPAQSWLMVKLTAPFRPLSDPYAHQIFFTPPAGWDPSRRGCRDQTRDGVPLFGQRMPSTAPNTLPPDELDVIRRWIAQGAPP